MVCGSRPRPAELGLDGDGLASGQPPAQPVIGRRLEEVQVELLAGGALRFDFGSGRRLAARESHPRQPLRREVLVLVGAESAGDLGGGHEHLLGLYQGATLVEHLGEGELRDACGSSPPTSRSSYASVEQLAAGSLGPTQPPFAQVDAREQGAEVRSRSGLPLRQPGGEPPLGAETRLAQLAAGVVGEGQRQVAEPASGGGSSAAMPSASIASSMARPISSRKRQTAASRMRTKRINAGGGAGSCGELLLDLREPPRRAVDVAGAKPSQRVEGAELGMPREGLLGQRRRANRGRRGARRARAGRAVALDQARRELGVAAGERVVDRLGNEPALVEPGRGAPVERRRAAGSRAARRWRSSSANSAW